jgi:hypothetical protein
MMSHLEFKELPVERSRKTKMFEVLSNHSGCVLGRIGWYCGWRCYVLYPLQDVEENYIWSYDCLNEVSVFIKRLMDDRKGAI